MTYGRYEGINGRLYALFGQSYPKNRFYTCDPAYSPPTWTELASPPSKWGQADSGANIAYCYIGASGERLVFAILGKGSREFWVFNIAINTWKRLEDIPVAATVGSALEVGNYASWNGYPCVAIYFLRGLSATNNFYHYHYPYIYPGGSKSTVLVGTVARYIATGDHRDYICTKGYRNIRYHSRASFCSLQNTC